MGTAETLVRSARAADDAARAHKRLERYHRLQAQMARREFDRLVRQCREMGIEVVVDG